MLKGKEFWMIELISSGTRWEMGCLFLSNSRISVDEISMMGFSMTLYFTED